MALNEVELQKLVQKALKNDIDQGDMEVLHKELLKRHNAKRRENIGLNSQQERIILAACISYNDLRARFYYINERMAEWRIIDSRPTL